jgi:hypothetical protein
MNIELKDHFFRLQTGGEIPVDGDLTGVSVELCHQYSIVDLDTGKVLGKSSGEGILSVGTPAELEIKYPGFAERMEWIKNALVTEAMQIIANRKAAELAALENLGNNPLTPPE